MDSDNKVWCGYCKHFLDGKCWKKNIKVSEDNLSDCKTFEGMYSDVWREMWRSSNGQIM